MLHLLLSECRTTQSVVSYTENKGTWRTGDWTAVSSTEGQWGQRTGDCEGRDEYGRAPASDGGRGFTTFEHKNSNDEKDRRYVSHQMQGTIFSMVNKNHSAFSVELPPVVGKETHRSRAQGYRW